MVRPTTTADQDHGGSPEVWQSEHLADGWHGVLADVDGMIHGIPANGHNGQQGLIFDPAARTVDNTTVAGFPGGRMWVDGIYSPGTQKIYAIPEQSESVMIIDLATDTFDLASIVGLVGNYKWWGGVLAPNGTICGMPCPSDSVLIIGPSTNTGVNTTAMTGFGTQHGKWKQAVVAGNGLIYGIPANSPSVLIVDPETDVADAHTLDDLFGPCKWHHGLLGPIRLERRQRHRHGLHVLRSHQLQRRSIRLERRPGHQHGQHVWRSHQLQRRRVELERRPGHQHARHVLHSHRLQRRSIRLERRPGHHHGLHV